MRCGLLADVLVVRWGRRSRRHCRTGRLNPAVQARALSPAAQREVIVMTKQKMPRRRREIWNSRAIRWPCKDCGCEVAPVRRGMRHTWGVRDEIWKEAGMKLQGRTPMGFGEFLCMPCLNKRLGRKLSWRDLSGGYSTHVPVTRKKWREWGEERRLWKKLGLDRPQRRRGGKS
jgi:hypothetical protein